jgi:hypothetical protein
LNNSIKESKEPEEGTYDPSDFLVVKSPKMDTKS